MGVNFFFSCGHWLNERCIEPIEHITTQIAIPISKTGATDVNFFFTFTTEPTFEQSPHQISVQAKERIQRRKFIFISQFFHFSL